MGLLISLGVNQTLAIQLGLFLMVYAILKYVLFEPYFKAFNKRAEATVGQTELAERYIEETKQLEEKFASAAQQLNERYKYVYDQSRGEAMREYDKQVNNARSEAKNLIENARLKIQAQVGQAQGELRKEIPGVTRLITQKLIGKDIGA
ncbi:MAG: ATP synthase F0 subunit B [Bdellovibrionales bacterium]